MPQMPDCPFQSLSWTLLFAHHCRLLSRAMSGLFSPGLYQMDLTYYITTISQLDDDLEQWRLSVPEAVRPGISCQPHIFRRPVTGVMTIWAHYLYYGFKLLLLRSYLQLTAGNHETDPKRIASSRSRLSEVSRSILEMTTYVDVEPSTPLW